MRRHYFISDNLDDLEVFEEQLEAAGISTPQIHVLSPTMPRWRATRICTRSSPS